MVCANGNVGEEGQAGKGDLHPVPHCSCHHCHSQGAIPPNLKSAGISPGMLCPVGQHFMGCLQSGTKAASLCSCLMTLLLPLFLPPLCIHQTGLGFMLLNLLPVSPLAAVSLPSNTNEKHFQTPTL